MLRSLLNSARGRSAVVGMGGEEFPADYSRVALQEKRIPATLSPRETPVNSATIAPQYCCVYCGHPLYATQRIARVLCPRCFQELPVRNISLAGLVNQEEILTAGKIIVTPDARVAARLVACTVDISGFVLGDVLASQFCRLRSSGKVAGRILCRRLWVEPGAQLDAQVELIRP